MKTKLFFIIAACFFMLIQKSFAQKTDLSVFSIQRPYNHTSTNLVWFTHSAPKYFLEVRANFDWNNTVGIYAGKTFGTDTFWIIPEIGGLFGTYKGFGPEVLLGGKYKRIKYFSFNQFVKNVNNLTDFFFQYAEIMVVASKHLALGGGVQTYLETTVKSDAYTDIGPVVKFSFSSFYIKPGHEEIKKIIVGLGYVF